MKIKHLFLSVLAMASVAVACNKNVDPNDGKPSLTLNPTDLTFDVDGGTKTIAVEANREWSIVDGDKNDWVKAEKASDTEITVTVEPNTGFDRKPVEFTVRMVGVKKTFKVSQKGSGAQEDAYVYFNNFDKTAAAKNSDNKWPYCDQTDCWKNEKGSGIATVEYKVSGLSPRTNDKGQSNGEFSDYAGSGTNYIWFSKSSSLQINNITLPADGVNFTLSFGAERNEYTPGKEIDNTFKPEEFPVYISNDGQKWVALDYAFAKGTNPVKRWDLASSTFTLPAGTQKLYIHFAQTYAGNSAYALDDVNLSKAAAAGTAIDFSKGVELGGGTTPTPGPEPTPEGAIFSETFSASQGKFTIEDKKLPEGATYVWTWGGAKYGMKASAYIDGKNLASESWLISPEIDLTSEKAAFLTFEHAANKFPADKKVADFVSAKISKDGTTWDNLTIPTWPSGKDWTFVSSGSIDLKAYLGSKVKIAFVYTSKDGESGTWEIKNVLVKAEGTTEPVGPTPEPTDPTVEGGYELSTATVKGTNNGYAKDCDIEVNKVVWNFTGNSTINPWRMGGKSLDKVDRVLYSKTALASKIVKIVVEHGTANDITVNSITLTVHNSADDAKTGANAVSTLKGDFVANDKTTFNSDADWTGKYYRFVYNVSVSGDKNKFFQFKSAKFSIE